MDTKALAALLFPNVTKTPEDMEALFPARTLPEGAVVSRMAPSPTGFVHLGNLVQGLTSERMCHQSGGTLFLRVEDTDAKREVAGAVEVLIESLKHYSILFDEGATVDGDNGIYGPYRQRRRAAIYHVYAKHLVELGLAYPCFCTEEELADIHARQEAEKANYGYFGKWAVWRDRPMEDIEAALDKGMPWVLRFRSTGSLDNKIKFTDLIKGNLELTENDIDHVLLKSDGIPTYHFAHAVDDHLMRTTHVVRGDEWLPTLPFHLQLFRALGFKPPKYLHIGPLMKMDGESKRKLSKRKDPELALTYYREAGFPVASVYEYLMTVLNSNFEEWRRQNPDAPVDSFKFSYKKMNPAGSLFDAAKLRDVSKNVISRMSADRIFEETVAWAKDYDTDLYEHLCANESYAKAIFAIGRGGKKPRKDFAVLRDVRPYLDFFYDDWFTVTDAYPEQFEKADIKAALAGFLKTFDAQDDMTVWFDKIKAVADSLGFASDMKAYKENPEAWRGNVADISMFLRVAVTGRQNSPDMYAAMQVLGSDRVVARIQNMIDSLK
ncbi:MAG: glutamate--tRNA ligase [Ruminococcaceae bacterium]|nr:glutamate--tRNA ligase [Oscillospiraceae bacterium]